MNYHYKPPLLPTFCRMRALRKNHPHSSLLRALMYEKLQSLQISGVCLDFGGGQRSHYRKLLPHDINLSSININDALNPSYILEPRTIFPFADYSFDFVLSLNTLEHVYDSVFVIREMHRVASKGGRVILMVPFMYRIHAAPDDFSRHTPSWWKETMLNAGFSSLEIEALAWGKASFAAGFFAHTKHKRQKFSMARDVIRARKECGNAERYFGEYGKRVSDMALAYSVIATK